MLPEYDEKGKLPSGIHHANWQEVVQRFGQTSHRQTLLNGLRRACHLLRSAGCRFVYLDGSFVTDKERILGLPPGDFDACWDSQGVDMDRLYATAPVLFDFGNGRALQKWQFGGELFPAELPNGVGGLTFLEFFQNDKDTGERKGIVCLDLSTLP